MSVDVVIPIYNGSKWIEQTLDSVFAQSVKPDQVIVVDDYSDDDSYEKVSRIAGVKLLKNQAKGVVGARNMGFFYTKASYIAFLDADDIWHKDHLKLLLDILGKNPQVPAAASSQKSFNDGEEPKFDLKDKRLRLMDPWQYFPAIASICNPMLFRKAALGQTPWIANHAAMSDYSILMKVALQGKFIKSGMRTLAYRKHPKSYTSAIERDPIAYVRLWEQVSADLLVSRADIKKDKIDESLFRKRHSIVQQIRFLLEAILTNNKDKITEVSSLLEKALSGEHNKYSIKFFDQVIDFLALDFFTEGKAENLQIIYIKLLENWSKTAKYSKIILLSSIIERSPGIAFYFNYIIKSPNLNCFDKISTIIYFIYYKFVHCLHGKIINE